MTIEELVHSTLQTRAGLVQDTVVTARSSAALARARSIRSRRRVSVAALAAITVVGAALMIRTEALYRADDQAPAGSEDRVLSVRDSFAGRTLIGSAETTDGRELVLRAGSARGTDWMVSCARVGSEYTVHASLDGAKGYTAPCEELTVLGDAIRIRVEPKGSGFESELRLWLTRSDDSARATPAGAVLAAAAYALPEPVDTLAGAAVYQVEENFGAEWAIHSSAESQPGDRSVSLEIPARPGATMLELLSGGSGEATVRLVVDGVRVHTVPAVYVLGGRDIGDMLTGGVSHRVTLWIPEEVPDDAQLAIVARERVG